MEIFKSESALILAILALLLSLVMASVMVVMSRLAGQRSESKYNEERHRAELSLMRESFERRLEAVNEQLMSNDNRWREVNHLLISAQKPIRHEKESSSPRPFPRILSDAGISPDEAKEEANLVFVLTPFGKDFEEDFNTVKNICEGVGLRCVRGDENHATGDILSHVLRLIWKSKYIIANITSRNANVYYELGIAQALGKPVILITRDLGGLSFDLQSQRVVVYKDNQTLVSKLKDMLFRTILNEKKTF